MGRGGYRSCGEHHESAIREAFGERVAAIVRNCSDGVRDATGKKPPWRQRKQAYLQHLREDADTLIVSASDKLHNARATLADLRAGRAGGVWK